MGVALEPEAGTRGSPGFGVRQPWATGCSLVDGPGTARTALSVARPSLSGSPSLLQITGCVFRWPSGPVLWYQRHPQWSLCIECQADGLPRIPSVDPHIEEEPLIIPICLVRLLGTKKGQDLAKVTHTAHDAAETRGLIHDGGAGFLNNTLVSRR